MYDSFAVYVPNAELDPEPLAPARVLAGTPEASGRVLWESPDGRTVRGIRQLTPGVLSDVAADELFVVVSGRATIEIEDGPVLEVGPGDVCVLNAGDRTVWTVHETLRKAYAITLPARYRRPAERDDF
ncbi:cupin domain-containing protein [Kitasatospora viridis]|uniref:(S)-ureidoglycine aminohydrolase cupin domain-containing protein n=1 Tax=Kitasatospora viridis TaxID=281105 RepID=A0A561T7A0_9ACTN|nr:cupin domain-containing protein [Kitasatospora viridis]TWF82980.1 hypothetical protein FHX73_14463 [Kitasatospora viridis]